MFSSKNTIKYGVYSSISLTALYLTKYIQNNDIKMGVVGLLGQITTDLFFHPLDLVNTRTKFYFNEKVNAFDMSRRIITTTGWTGLFRGGSVTLLGSGFAGFIYFSWYKKLKDLFKKILEGEENINYVVYTFASILSEFIIYPLFYPFDLVKTRIQTGQFAYKNFFDGVKDIYFNSPNKGFKAIKEYYVGFCPSFALSLMGTFLVFFTFELTRDYIAEKKNIKSEEIVGLNYFLCSFIAGFVSASSLNFLEVYSIQKMIHGDKISFRNFISLKNFNAIKSGLVTRIFFGVFYTVFLLEAINFYGKIYHIHL